jgi:hypothetical protein
VHLGNSWNKFPAMAPPDTVHPRFYLLNPFSRKRKKGHDSDLFDELFSQS